MDLLCEIRGSYSGLADIEVFWDIMPCPSAFVFRLKQSEKSLHLNCLNLKTKALRQSKRLYLPTGKARP